MPNSPTSKIETVRMGDGTKITIVDARQSAPSYNGPSCFDCGHWSTCTIKVTQDRRLSAIGGGEVTVQRSAVPMPCGGAWWTPSDVDPESKAPHETWAEFYRRKRAKAQQERITELPR